MALFVLVIHPFWGSLSLTQIRFLRKHHFAVAPLLAVSTISWHAERFNDFCSFSSAHSLQARSEASDASEAAPATRAKARMDRGMPKI